MKRLALTITLLICVFSAGLASNGSTGKGMKWNFDTVSSGASSIWDSLKLND